MKRLTLLLLSLAAVGAILWVTVFGASGTRAPAPGQRTEPPRAPRSTKLRIAGHVQTQDGTPVKGATVFVLPKERRGSNRDRADHEVTGADGRWSLRTRKTVGCWIGVVAPGYRNAYLDGDGVDPAVQMFLVVEPAPEITVTLRDPAGAPLAGRGVQVVPWPDSGASYYLPGPRARQGEQWRVTNEQGRVVFRRGDRGPVAIRAHVEGFHSGEAYTWLPATAGDVVLTLRPNATLELALRDAVGGGPLAGLVTVEFFDPDQGSSLFAFTESTEPAGVLRLARALPWGTFGMQVAMEGRASWIRAGIVVADAAQVHVVEVPLVPAVAPGALTLQLLGNHSRVPPGARKRAPLTFLRRRDGDWARRVWQAGAPERWQAAAQTIRFELEPGTYDVLVADVMSGRAALEQGLVVTAGSERTLQLAMKPGQRGRLPPMHVRGAVARTLAVRDPAGAALPVYGGTRNGRLRAGRALDVIGRALDGTELYLGPYPLDEFSVTIRRSDGSQESRTFR